MESQQDKSGEQLLSKEAAALAGLSADPIQPHKARRVRRRRRSLRRRLVDSLMPFAVLVGLTIFAVGLVQVVEMGAAKSSKVKSKYTVEAYEYAPREELDFELAQERHRDLMRRHAELKGRKQPVKQSQVAYQLALEAEVARDMSGLSHIVPRAEATKSDDVMDWSLFEQGSEDPRSTLQRTGVTQKPAPR